MIAKVFGLIKQLFKEPEKAVKYAKEPIHVPILIWILTSIFILLPSAFIIPVEHIPNWLLIIPDLIFMGFVALGGFWIYSWAVLVVAAKVTGYKEEPKQIFKILGYAFGPVLFVAVAGTLLSFILFLLEFTLLNFSVFIATVIVAFVSYLYVLAHAMKKMYGDETLFVIYFALTMVLLVLG